jgi:hypothetical protein
MRICTTTIATLSVFSLVLGASCGPPPGTLHGFCLPDLRCDAGLECQAGVCMLPTAREPIATSSTQTSSASGSIRSRP